MVGGPTPREIPADRRDVTVLRVTDPGQLDVGFASSCLTGRTFALCNLGVLGPGVAGVSAGPWSWLASRTPPSGATTVVSAPSPDGWALQRTQGFPHVPMVADTCLYLPQVT